MAGLLNVWKKINFGTEECATLIDNIACGVRRRSRSAHNFKEARGHRSEEANCGRSVFGGCRSFRRYRRRHRLHIQKKFYLQSAGRFSSVSGQSGAAHREFQNQFQRDVLVMKI